LIGQRVWSWLRGVAGLAVAIALLSGCSGTPLGTSASPSPSAPPSPSIVRATLVATATSTAPQTVESPGTGLPPPRLPAGASADVDDITYQVTGDSADDLVAAMEAKHLRDEAGDSAFALTTWSIRWTYRFVDAVGGGCGLTGAEVIVEVDVLIPSWTPPATADATTVDRWGRFINALEVHERGHVQNGLDRAGEIAVALSTIEPEATCPALEDAADAATGAIIKKGNDFDRTYDDQTNHGATQGAVFP
jgi:predicted secreted Zn-dependent protease